MKYDIMTYELSQFQEKEELVTTKKTCGYGDGHNGLHLLHDSNYITPTQL